MQLYIALLNERGLYSIADTLTPLILAITLNTCMKIEQLSEVLGKQRGNSNAERMNEAIRTVLTKDAELRSKGQRAYNEAKQKEFEKKMSEDMKHPQKRTFAEMVSRYL